MKKIHLTLLAVIFLFGLSKAQEKKYYPRTVISEEFISNRLIEARIAGADEKEVSDLREHLHKLYKTQKENEISGIDSRTQIPPPQVLSGCVNPGFEDGTINGWLLEVGDNSTSASLPCPTCFTGPGGVYQVLSPGSTSNVNTLSCFCGTTDCATQPSTGGVDGFGGFSTTAPAPLGGNCLLMNNSTCNYKMERASQTFVVGATNNIFTFGYAAVLQSGGHAPSSQPYFHVDVTNNTTGSVIPCTQYDASPPTSGSLNGWSASTVDNTVYTKPWTIVTLDLSSFMGNTVTVNFTVSDCNQGGHFGYCYIDAICSPSQITITKQLCAGGGAAILSGPPGMASYNWSGPVTGTSQNLTTSTPGNYTLTTTNQTGCPAPILYATLVLNPVPTPSFTASGAACSSNELFTDASTISSGSIASWHWNFGNGTTAISNTAGNTHNVGYASPGTYTVTLTDTSAAGCVGTYSNVVTISPGVNDVFTASTVCLGAATSFNNTSSGGTGYIWDFGDGSATVSTGTTTPNQSHTYATAGTFVATLSVTTTGTCVATSTVNVTVNAPPPVTATGNSICNGAGPVNITAGGAATYTWNSGSTANPLSVNPASTTTYTVTGTSAAGCTNTATCTVNVISNPTITVANTSICAGQTATLTANSNAATFAWSGPNLVTNTGTVVTATPAATSTYTVIGSAGTCTVSTTAVVTINSNIVPTFTASTVCQGQPTQLTSTTAGVTSYTWDYGDGAGTTTIPNPTETYSAAGTYVASYSVINSSGCSGNTSVTVTVNANPLPAFTSSTPCQGTAVSFTNNTPAAPTIATWGWAFGDGQTSTAQAPTNNYAAAGVYTTTLTATTTSGCTNTVTASVVVHPNPVANFSANAVCLNTPPTQFTDASSLVNPAGITDNIATYAWSFGDGNTSSTTGNVTNSYATCGNFNASLTVVTNNLCTNTFTLPVTVNCVPVLTPPASPTVCPNTAVSPGAFSIDIPGSTPSWTASTTVTGVSASGTGTVPGYTTMTPNLTGGNISDVIAAIPTSPAGCIGLPQTFTITVKPTPLMNSMPDIAVCDQGNIAPNAFGSSPGGSTFTWANSNTTVGLAAAGAGNLAPFTGQSGGSPTAVVATVSVIPTLNGCVGPDSTFLITIAPQPTLTIVSPAPACPGTPIQTATCTLNPNDPNTTLNWTNNNTATGLPASGGPAISGTVTASPNATLANIVSVITVTPAIGTCIGQPATYTVTVLPTPVINVIPDVEYCPGVSTNSIAISMTPVNGGLTGYNWNAPTGASIGMTTTNGITNVIPSFTTIGAATAQTSQVIVSASLDNCPAIPITFNITINPNPVATFSASTKVCLGTGMNFYDASSVGSGSITQWAWDFNNDNIFGDAVSQNPQFVFTTAGSHTVGLEVTTNKGCTAVTEIPVYVNYIPVPQFSGDVLSGCPQHPVIYSETSYVPGGGPAVITNWGWSFGNGTTFSSQSAGTHPPSVIYDNTSATQNAYFTVSLQVTTDSGCTAIQTYTNYITVFSHPIAGFTWGPTDPAPDIDNPTVNFIDQSLGAYGPSPDYGPLGIQWDLGDTYALASDNLSQIKYPVHAYTHVDPYNNSQYYTVTQWVENSHGCKDSIKKVVEILPVFDFYIPNAFSPNGDGINDGFKGTGIGVDNDTYNLWIFDRWGMQIFYTNDMEKHWDGKILGKGGDIVQEDVYVWKVKFKDFTGRKHEYKGTVSVIK